jgi:hypothetical protein
VIEREGERKRGKGEREKLWEGERKRAREERNSIN